MRTIALSACLVTATAASAAPYTDYIPKKSSFEITVVAVDPTRLDDYLTALRAQAIPCWEAMKKAGVIDDYGIAQKLTPDAKGGNVLLWLHHPSLTTMEPDQQRDQEIDKVCDTDASKKKRESFNDYRKFQSNDIWMEVEYPKPK